MARIVDALLSLVIPGLVLLHLVLTPYTKVEESFNIQAIHDFLSSSLYLPSFPVNGTVSSPLNPTENFDHITFPGAVPRSAIGAYIVSVITYFVVGLARGLGLAIGLDGEKNNLQLVARGVLGLANAWALRVYMRGLEKAHGKAAGRWFVLFLASQFHVIFYASRTWPNMFAFLLTTLAQRQLLPDQDQGQQASGIWLFLAAGVIFRSEISILLAVHLAPVLLISLSNGIIPFRIIGALVVASLTPLTLTFVFDSYFWGRWVWPELAGVYFNVFQGKSSEWGTSPYHTYFTNFLPKMLKNPAVLLLIGLSVVMRATRSNAIKMICPALAFVMIYSLQPHKEPRFIIYVVPPLTGAAALAANQFSARRSILTNLVTITIFATTILSWGLTIVQLLVSSLNYPGGEALSLFHTHIVSLPHVTTVQNDNLAIVPAYIANVQSQYIASDGQSSEIDQEVLNTLPIEVRNAMLRKEVLDRRRKTLKDTSPTTYVARPNITVHVDVLSCMTGITRFQQRSVLPIPIVRDSATDDQSITKVFPISISYDKTEDAEKLLHPGFWAGFDYALMEEPGKAIGKWVIIRTVYGFAGWNELLRPGDEVETTDSNKGLALQETKQQWSSISRYDMLVFIRTWVRKLSGGWWYGPKMEAKIYILRQVKAVEELV
ncbi:Alg9-like mannosyltransferase family-domain-containing protein [Calycina marina]|uniref:Mannosyltransferase n=1 Tax=Calycina marina TaxID=1763456 RepID=A0A9P7Z136_9HELO|nr:Alg9-like mannosyltransferase family-domain-containing protein [Calycina marina]